MTSFMVQWGTFSVKGFPLEIIFFSFSKKVRKEFQKIKNLFENREWNKNKKFSSLCFSSFYL